MAAPPGDRLNLNFSDPLSPPAGGSVTLDFSIPSAMPMFVGLGMSSKFGYASIRQPRFLRPVGWKDSSFPVWPSKRPLIERDVDRIRPAPWVSSTMATPTYVSWRRYLQPQGFMDYGLLLEQVPVPRARYFGGYFPPPGGPNLILNFTEPLVPPPGSTVILEFGAVGSGNVLGVTLGDQTAFGTASLGQASQISPAGIPSEEAFGPLLVQGNIRYVQLSVGIYMQVFGTAAVKKGAQAALPGGIAPPSQTAPANGNRQIPNPWISYRVRNLTGSGNIFAFVPNNSHHISQWLQYSDVAGRGIAAGSPGTPSLQHRHRYVYPASVISLVWGTTTVKRRYFVDPVGWDSATFSDNAELLINTRRVHAHSGSADPAGYGINTIFNWRQDVSLHNHGWYDTQWNFPIVFNLKREIKVGAYENNTDPTSWTNFFPFVDNKDRRVSTFGHQSSRFGVSAWIRNFAEPVFPIGSDLTIWGPETFISHRNRSIIGQGWDSFYNTRYTVVWNKADVVGPATVGDTVLFGRPDPVLNLNRTVKHHSGWLGPVWGLPFIAYRVRTLQPNLFYDVPASFPEVRYNPHPFAPTGIPWQGQVGGHEVRTFIREALPKSVNVHDPWFGEPILRNRNLEVGPYGYDQSELPRPDVQNYIRYVAPEWINPEYFTPPLISHRTRTVYPTTTTAPVITVLHRIRKDSPDPPSQQRITLNDMDGDGQEGDGQGIAPPGMPSPSIKLATIYPIGLDEVARFGTHKIHTNNIQPGFIFQDGLLGTPVLIYTRYITAFGRGSTFAAGSPRITPWNIYAPAGDRMPIGYNPDNPFRHRIGDRTPPSRNGSMFPWFGDATVTNQHRAIGPVPTRNADPANGFDYYPRYGTPRFTLRRQYVYPTGIRSLRFGQIIFLNVPQYVNFDDEENPQGIPSSTQWGATRVAFPPVPPDPNRRVYPAGLFALVIPTTHRVELFNRTIPVAGIPHRGNPQQGLTSPWGTPLVGYPRVCTIGMGVQTRWGTAWVEFLNRPVYPSGWNGNTLEDGNFENFRYPMKVVRVNPPAHIPSIASTLRIGTCTFTQFHRNVYARSIDGYNSGRHSVNASSVIGVQGWESLLVGDIDRWEAGKIKAHGDDLSTVGTPHLLHPLRPGSISQSAVASPRVASVLQPIGVPNIAFEGPVVTNPFGCTNRAVSPLPILSTQTVPAPVVA